MPMTKLIFSFKLYTIYIVPICLFMCFECLTLRCSVENDESIHTEEMKQAAEQAKQEFLEQHPELAVTCASFNAQALVPVIGELPYNKMISSIS